MSLTSPERQLRTVLRVFAVLFGVAALGYGVGPFVGPFAPLLRRLPFVAFSAVKVFTLALVCLYGAGDPRERRGLVWVAVGGHALSVGAMLALLAFGDTSALVPVGAALLPVSRVLWGAMALDGVVTLVLALAGWRAGSAAAEGKAAVERVNWTVGPITRADRRLRGALVVLGVGFLVSAVFYEAGALMPATRAAFTELPFVTNSVVKVGTLGLVALYTARAIGPRIGLTGILFAAHVASIAVQLLFWGGAAGEASLPIGGREVAVRTALVAGAALDAVVATLILVLWRQAYSARFQPAFLSLRGYRTLIALADVTVRGQTNALRRATSRTMLTGTSGAFTRGAGGFRIGWLCS